MNWTFCNDKIPFKNNFLFDKLFHRLREITLSLHFVNCKLPINLHSNNCLIAQVSNCDVCVVLQFIGRGPNSVRRSFECEFRLCSQESSSSSPTHFLSRFKCFFTRKRHCSQQGSIHFQRHVLRVIILISFFISNRLNNM